jgi:hypothetical protein
VFVCLAVQNAGTETPFITYANGDEELFCPTNRPYLKDTVLTLRVTGKANAPTRGKVRLSWRLLLLSWKIEDGIESKPVSLEAWVGEKNAQEIRARDYVREFEERRKS